jgi:hypothetical protein
MLYLSKQGAKLAPFSHLPKQCAMGGDKPVEGMCRYCSLLTFYTDLQGFENLEGMLLVCMTFMSEQVFRPC